MKKCILNLLLVSFSIILISNKSLAVNSVPASLKAYITQLEQQEVALQGGAIAILDKGKVVYKKTFGRKRGKNGAAINASTLFPLASVSKPVAATAVALLVDDGKLNLNERYKFPYLDYTVDLKNILGHTTGYKFSGNLEIEHGLNRKKILKVLQHQVPACKPGECYSYSNTTFSLVEEALNTKHLSLYDAIKNLRHILNTPGVQVLPLDSNDNIAYPHFSGKNKKRVIVRKALPFPPYYPKAAPAAAGVFASLDGMIEIFKLNFGYRPDLISQKTLDAFHTPIIANRDIAKWHAKWPVALRKIESYYGVGWRVLKAKNYPNKDLIFHSGAIAGIRTFIGFIPEKEMGIIILVNQNSDFTHKQGIGFWGEFLKKA